jgi:hypothetical protein
MAHGQHRRVQGGVLATSRRLRHSADPKRRAIRPTGSRFRTFRTVFPDLLSFRPVRRTYARKHERLYNPARAPRMTGAPRSGSGQSGSGCVSLVSPCESGWPKFRLTRAKLFQLYRLGRFIADCDKLAFV